MEKPGHVREIQQGRRRDDRIAGGKEDHRTGRPPPGGIAQIPFRLQDHVDRAVHREQRHRRDADQQGKRVEQIQEHSRELAPGVQGHPPHDVAERDAHQERRENAREREAGVPQDTPPGHRLLAPELNRDGAENQGEQEEDERVVEAREDGRVHFRKGREQRAAAGHQPDLVPVPHRADRVQHQPPVLVLFRKQMQNADAQIEPVEDRITGQQDADQRVPDHMEIEEVHFGRNPISRSSASGPCLIF